MNKLFVVLMTLALLVGVGNVFAAADIEATAGGIGMGTLRVYTCINNTGALYDTTNIATTVIIPSKSVIMGYSACVIGKIAEGLFSIRDASSTTVDTDSFILAENETTSSLPITEWFPEGLNVARGVTITQGPQTAVSVYYIQVKP